MFDQINLFNPKKGKFFWLLGQGGTFVTGGSRVWNSSITIPRNASWVYLLAIGGGAGGAGGQSSATGVVGGGGGGGASGAISSLIVPAALIPKTLYLSAGIGGASVAAATAGNNGLTSIIADQQSISVQDIILGGGSLAIGAIAPAGASS